MVNTTRETSTGLSCDHEWNHQCVINVCQNFEKIISDEKIATLRVLRAGDVFDEGGKITADILSDRKMCWKLSRQIAQSLNLSTCALANANASIAVTVTDLTPVDIYNLENYVTTESDEQQAESLSKFVQMSDDEDTDHSNTVALQYRCAI